MQRVREGSFHLHLLEFFTKKGIEISQESEKISPPKRTNQSYKCEGWHLALLETQNIRS